MRSMAGVGITPPNVPGAPNPWSSVMMSSTFGAPFGGTTRGDHQGVDSEAFSLITPPNGGSGGGSCFPLSVVVAPGEPGTPVTCCAITEGTLAPTATVAASSNEVRMRGIDWSPEWKREPKLVPVIATRTGGREVRKLPQTARANLPLSDRSGPYPSEYHCVRRRGIGRAVRESRWLTGNAVAPGRIGRQEVATCGSAQ